MRGKAFIDGFNGTEREVIVFDGKYTISAGDAGWFISTGFTSGTPWSNPYSGTPPEWYHVYSKGNLHDFTLAGSAFAEVIEGGMATNVQVQNGGSIVLSSGGIARNLQVESGGNACLSGAVVSSLSSAADKRGVFWRPDRL